MLAQLFSDLVRSRTSAFEWRRGESDEIEAVVAEIEFASASKKTTRYLFATLVEVGENAVQILMHLPALHVNKQKLRKLRGFMDAIDLPTKTFWNMRVNDGGVVAHYTWIIPPSIDRAELLEALETLVREMSKGAKFYGVYLYNIASGWKVKYALKHVSFDLGEYAHAPGHA